MVPPPACFNLNTLILCRVDGEDQYIPIQNIRPGMMVKTHKHGYKPVDMIGVRKFMNSPQTTDIGNKLYVCSPANYPEVNQDLIMTGHHAVLVGAFKGDQKERTQNALGNIFITDDKYRLPLCADDRATIYNKAGETLIFHLALEHNDYYMNYGIYANGLLVETCSKRFLKELSGMSLITAEGGLVHQNTEDCHTETMVALSEAMSVVM